MGKIFFLLNLPISVVIIYIIIVIVWVFWNDYKVLHWHWDSSIDGHRPELPASSTMIIFSLLIQIFVSFYIYFFKILQLWDCALYYFYISNFQHTQMLLFTWLFVFVSIILFLNIKSYTRYTTDVAIFLIFIYLFAYILIFSTNLLIIFVTLEIFNILIIYSFGVYLRIQPTTYKVTYTRILWLVKTLMYQFILNFFSSIILFISYNLLLTHVYTSNLIMLSNFIIDQSNIFATYIFTGLYIAFFIKFGIGPWIFFKIEIYEFFNYFLIILYTIIYFSIILIFFINLFCIYCLSVSIFTLILIFLILIIIVWYFIFHILTYYNIFIFLSFSSLINFILIFFQLFITIFITQFLFL